MFRRVAATELSRLLAVLAHPARLQLIEELRGGERDVGALTEALRLPPSGVSQHLAKLRAHRLVVERRGGRRIYYRLRSPTLAEWLVRGLDLVLSDVEHAGEVGQAVEQARRHWSDPAQPPFHSS